jgi:diaminopimelate epimerase
MKKTLRFSKMQGLGNDFVVVDAINQTVDDSSLASLSEKVCDRHFGIGADGLILVLPSDHSDFKMRILNADGSEPQMCGNGIRCFARFVYEQGLTEKEVFSVETLAGVIVPALVMKDGKVISVEVDMGEPILERGRIPMAGGDAKNQVVSQPVELDGQTYLVTAVSMGNPHAVIFVDDLTAIDIEKIGPKFEHHPLFPERTNTEFVQILSPNEAVLIVWERGSGETLACGTGACAVTVAGVLNQKLGRKALIHLPGGDLSIEWQDDNHVMMTGPAELVFKGEITL